MALTLTWANLGKKFQFGIMTPEASATRGQHQAMGQRLRCPLSCPSSQLMQTSTARHGLCPQTTATSQIM